MNKLSTKPLEVLLLDILDSTHTLENEMALDEPDFALVATLVSKRGNKLLDFSNQYQLLNQQHLLDNRYAETFTKIYSQIIKKQQELVDTTNRKINSVSKELSSIRKGRKMRSSYSVNQFTETPNNSVLITSKIQG